MRVFDYIVLFWLIFLTLYLFVSPVKLFIDGLF